MSKLDRKDWLALLAGVALGVAIGLFYTWTINPVEYVNTAPSSMRESYQQEYVSLIAASYQQTGNLERAEARLALFKMTDPSERLAEMAQVLMAEADGQPSAQALARLASDLAARPTPPAASRTPTGLASAPTGTAVVATGSTRTPTARPSRTPTAAPTAGPPFQLVNREAICDPVLAAPLLQIEVVDGAGQPVPGIEVRVFSDQGDDRFYTGLKPELGLGYADFEMDPASSYTVQLPEAAEVVTAVESQPCTPEAGEPYAGSILLVFEQPEVE